MFTYITNPITRKYNIHSTQGKQLLKNYINKLNGGGEDDRHSCKQLDYLLKI